MISPRHMLFVIATFGLIAVLVFLYYKTEAVNVSERNEVVASLRDLQEIESRWDNDVLSMRLEMEPGQIGSPNRAPAAQNALKALSRLMPRVNSAALSESMGKITKEINEKANLIEQFKAETQPLLTSDQARILAEVLTHVQLKPGEFNFNFNF